MHTCRERLQNDLDKLISWSEELKMLIKISKCKVASCRQAAATICSRPSPPSVGAEAPRAAETTAAPADVNVAVGSHAQYVPTQATLTAAAG